MGSLPDMALAAQHFEIPRKVLLPVKPNAAGPRHPMMHVALWLHAMELKSNGARAPLAGVTHR